jgi:hypothetical protein
MSGTAIMGDNLIDDLVADVDELRGDLNADFGTRPFNFQTILRTWLGDSGMIGDPDFRDVVTTITPAPRVEQWDGYKWVLLAAGVHEDGEIRVSEVSLSYTYGELTGKGLGAGLNGNLEKNQQFFYRLVDAHGQGQEERILRPNRPPFVDREKTIGWMLWLMDMNLPRTAGVEVNP